MVYKFLLFVNYPDGYRSLSVVEYASEALGPTPGIINNLVSYIFLLVRMDTDNFNQTGERCNVN